MATKTAPSTEPIDLKEVIATVDSASHLLAHAAETLSHVTAIFQSINAASSSGTLAGRLSRLGEVICEDRASEFIQHRDAFYTLTERFMAEVNDRAEVSHV